MRVRYFAGLTGTLFAAALMLPAPARAQKMTHAQAKAAVEARDAQHHNKAKTEVIPTAGGAVGGGVVGGPAGAFAGAKIGHSIGSGFHAVKKHHDIKQAEKHGMRRNHRVRRVHGNSHATVHGRRAG